MSRKQILMLKAEPEESFDFNELFPVVNENPFSPANDSSEFENAIGSKPTKSDVPVPALWFIEKCRVEEAYPNGVPKSKSLAELGTSKEQVLSRILPMKKDLAPDVMQRANELKEQERINHEDFIANVLNQYPVDKSYHPNKARKYASSDASYDADEDSKRQSARKNNNGKSMESRYKKKVERAVNAYTIIHLRERILAYQTRMSMMKEMLLQEHSASLSTMSDDQQNTEEISMFDESDIESLSSISSF